MEVTKHQDKCPLVTINVIRMHWLLTYHSVNMTDSEVESVQFNLAPGYKIPVTHCAPHTSVTHHINHITAQESVLLAWPCLQRSANSTT